MSQLTEPSASPFVALAPSQIPAVTPPQFPQIVAVMARLQSLYDQVATPGALLPEAVLSSDGSLVELRVASVAALASWFDAHPRCSASVTSRQGGGLDWLLSLRHVAPGVRLVLSAVSAEGEQLPDTRLVRDMCPEKGRRWDAEARRGVAA